MVRFGAAAPLMTSVRRLVLYTPVKNRGATMPELTASQVQDIQRRWAKDQFRGDVWLLIFVIAGFFIALPTTRNWIFHLIAPVPPSALLVAGLLSFWWPLTKYSRCPACRTTVGSRGRVNFCPTCGVVLRERRPPQV